MIVRFSQSGGWAGLLKGCELDTKTLPPEKAEKLRQLVEASAIPASGEFLSDSSRDLQQYEITIEDGASKTSVVFDDESIPQSAKPLIGFLKKCSKPNALEQ
jgi:Emfourin